MPAEHLVDSAVCILVPCRLGGEPDQVGAKGFLQGEAHPTPGWLWYLVRPTGGTMVTQGGGGKSTTPGGRIMVRGKEKLQKRDFEARSFRELILSSRLSHVSRSIMTYVITTGP